MTKILSFSLEKNESGTILISAEIDEEKFIKILSPIAAYLVEKLTAKQPLTVPPAQTQN